MLFDSFSLSRILSKTLLAFFITTTAFSANGATDAIDAIDALSPVGLVRLNASGESAMVPSAVIASPDGKPTLAATQTIDGKTTLYAIRYLANGAPDQVFGTSGRAVVFETSRCLRPPLMIDDGADVVIIAEVGTDDACASTAIMGWRVNASGHVDPGYTIARLPQAMHSSPVQLTHGAGRLLLSAVANATTVPGTPAPVAQAYVTALTAPGSADSAFGVNGIIPLTLEATTASLSARVASLTDSHVVIATHVGKQVTLSEWDANGRRVALPNSAPGYTFDFAPYAPGDATIRLIDFHRLADGANLVIVQRESATSNALIIGRISASLQGQSGTSMLINVGGPASWPVTLAAEDASVVIAELTGSGLQSTARLRRMYPDSSFDVTWGVGQAFQVGATNVTISGLARNARGQLVVTGRDVEGGFLRTFDMSLRPNYTKRFAVEYFNGVLNHYFMTANPTEIAAVDAGLAGPGWKRTNYGFNVHPVGAEIPDGAIAVCRFYGNTAINPATRQPYGPNSHVYLVDGSECANTKKDPGWIYEGVVFYVYALNVRAPCAYWQNTVRRFYNGRAAQNDSNHRYVIDPGQAAVTVAAGYREEGLAFCSPQ